MFQDQSLRQAKNSASMVANLLNKEFGLPSCPRHSRLDSSMVFVSRRVSNSNMMVKATIACVFYSNLTVKVVIAADRVSLNSKHLSY
jgi:hypothetical protein